MGIWNTQSKGPSTQPPRFRADFPPGAERKVTPSRAARGGSKNQQSFDLLETHKFLIFETKIGLAVSSVKFATFHLFSLYLLRFLKFTPIFTIIFPLDCRIGNDLAAEVKPEKD